MDSNLGLVALLVLFGGVAFGAIVPVVPTGALVSGAAALAADEHPWEIALVVALGAAGAWLGDIVVYGALRAAGAPLALRIGWLRADDPDGHLARLRAAIERHELRTLLVSRLVPGGRIPVLLAAALTGYSWRRFTGAAVAAATLWSAAYAAVGVAGGRLLPDDRVAVVVAAGAALLLTAALQIVRRWQQRSSTPS
ncbi:VTT domain-containing protein [Nocardioides sp. CBS4Y-1]|uniref:VTT domain-containing protein n=1 Tax=Nocardioides acrostichi TaxID=2784339 RepID=A0A930Y5M4_9ACTN|nr:VTT domain-containing protein [Nocardioides acrostichi]